MDFFRVRTNYSFLGNYIGLLSEKEQQIKNLFLDYQIQTKVEKVSNLEVKTFLFTNKNISIQFLLNRIDFDYKFETSTQMPQAAFNAACTFWAKLKGLQVSAKRIAVFTTGYIDNSKGDASRYLEKQLGKITNFGICNELKVRINNIKSYFEPLNSVLEITQGEAKNSNTNEVKPILLCSIDVNTLAGNEKERFKVETADKYFADLLLEEQDKVNILRNI